MNRIANLIKKLMADKNINQSELSKLSGITQSSLSDYINGKYKPKQDKIDLIAKALGVSPALFFEGLIDDDDVNIQELKSPSVRINVYGSIPAGIPLEAIEDIIGWEEIPFEWTRGDKEYIALKVKGDSMYPKYLDGDTVIIQLQQDCETGQDCACYVNGFDATLKRVSKNENSITLEPINPNYSPRTYKHPGEVHIIGIVKELRRKF